MAKNIKKKTAVRTRTRASENRKPRPPEQSEGKEETRSLRPQPADADQIKKIKIRVIGVGGGGGNIVSEIAVKISKASFVAANTDVKSLKGCSKNVIKFQFGQDLTRGLGTGMDPEIARTAAKNEKERIKKLCQGQDLCILVACLGGGTGSGAVTAFAKTSRELGNLTYGIFTLPFKFEGERKMEIAINALKEVKSSLNAITIIPNERIFQVINKDTPLREALSSINEFLSESLGGLIETIYQPGLINIDFADFKTVLEGRGRLAYLNTVEIQRKEGAIKEMMAKILSSPLYPYTIRGAKGVLFNIIGEKNLALFDVGQISKTISELVNPEAKIIFGISRHKKRSGAIKTVLLVVGCGTKIFSSGSGEKKTKKTKEKRRKAAAKKPEDKKELKEAKASFRPIAKTREVEEARASSPELPKEEAKLKEAKASSPELPEEAKGREKAKPLRPHPVPKKEIKKSEKKKPKSKTEKKPLKEKIQNSKIQKTKLMEKAKKDEAKPEKVRKNGLQIKKEIEEAEKEMLEKEKIWETPAFLRKRTN